MSEPSSSLPSRPETPLGALLDIQTTRPAFRFNYDSGIRKTGPESVSGTTEGRGADTFAAPPKLGFLNISAGSNAHLGLGALPAEWSSSKLGFHGAWRGWRRVTLLISDCLYTYPLFAHPVFFEFPIMTRIMMIRPQCTNPVTFIARRPNSSYFYCSQQSQ